jgi:serine phosphatase RsbU (regulator of sigma subunit)
VALVSVPVALVLAGPPAAGQLPAPAPLTQPGGAVRQIAEPAEPVRQIVDAPPPSPLEEVVQESPAAPVREAVREVAGNDPGSTLPGGSGPDVRLPGADAPAPGPSTAAVSQSPGPPAAPARAGSARPPAGGGDDRGGSGGSGRDAGRGERTAGGGDRSGAAGDGAGTADRAQTGGSADDAAAQGSAPSGGEGDADERGALARTVERVVEVVPVYVWIALGVLALLAAALGARSYADRRRTRALQRERERLLRDMGLLERVLLPEVPERLGDLAASVAYRPAGGPAAGGDFYDVFQLPGGRVALLVGDVSGHGREALERTSSLRPALRGHLEAGLSPRAALEAANRSLGVDASGGFTTAVVAVHDPGSGALTYAAAGHPPPVLAGPGAHAPVTVSSAPPLGVGLRTGLRQTTVPLPRGAAACFVTDGVLEARKDGAPLDREWLVPVVEAFGPLDSASALLEKVVETADEAPDDMTACLVRAVAGPERAGRRIEELELEPDDVGAAAPEQFLDACGVPAEAIPSALAEARRLAVKTGRALLTVTIDGGDASVRVTSPTRQALATT